MYEACRDMGMIMADNYDHRLLFDKMPRIYTYNDPEQSVRAIHLHAWNTCGNGIDERFNDLVQTLQDETDFRFVSEVAREATGTELVN